MRHFNRFHDEEVKGWDVMKSFTIFFKGVEFKIQLICIFNKCPEYFFFIEAPEEKACLMSRKKLPGGKPFWLSPLEQEDALALTRLIEEQTGIALPDEHINNNPFEYKGDIHVRIYAVRIKDVTIRKAKAPFGNDMYYQVIFEAGRTITFGRFCFDKDKPEGEWWPVESEVDPQDLKPFISLVNTCEFYNKWKLES